MTTAATAGIVVVVVDVVVVLFKIDGFVVFNETLLKILSIAEGKCVGKTFVDADLVGPEVVDESGTAAEGGGGVGGGAGGVSPRAASMEALEAAVAVGATAEVTTTLFPPLKATFGGEPTAVAV